jgi:serine/threonine protein phosphatase PrpC
MEDFSKSIDEFNGDKDKGLFALYDGHGGDQVAKFSKEKLPEIIAANLKSGEKNIEALLVNSFNKIDQELKTINSDHVGSTASVVLILKEKDARTNNFKKTVYCANVGDSRCVLVQNYSVVRLSYDHKATDFNEVKRVKSVGGIISNGRVLGQLMLTRALGDHALKPFGVSAVPYVSKNYITDKDRYIVLASDGVWDVLQDEDILKLSKGIESSDELAKIIVSNAIKRDSFDNISCLVLKLN